MRSVSLAAALSVASPVLAAAPESASGFSNKKAEAAYAAGIEKFDRGDFDEALVDLDASLRIEESAKALYAKAQSLNKLDRCREAVPIYNRVLKMLPDDSPAQPAVKDALVTCAEKLATEDTPPPVVLEPDDPIEDEPVEAVDEELTDDPAEPTGKRWYADPYAPVLAGLGLVGVGVGSYFLVEASRENKKQPMVYEDFEAKAERVQTLRIQGGVITGVGGALLLGGIIRYAVLGAREKRDMAFTPVASPRFTGLTLQGRF